MTSYFYSTALQLAAPGGAGKIKTNFLHWRKKWKMELNEDKIETESHKMAKVGLVMGQEWLKQCDRIPKVQQRVSFGTNKLLIFFLIFKIFLKMFPT